jgi:HAMP domain-containing protein/HPt (histidine-containing phosphotransfer) domain-containing protein/anti-sigma regulatory factor (Ser/Thr protein kinase)
MTLFLVIVGTISIVAKLQDKQSETHFKDIEARITSSLTNKGTILATNHALALRGFVEANAFGDVKDLVNRTVAEDPDVLYGLFIDADMSPWAFASPETKEDDTSMNGWEELGVTEEMLEQGAGSRKIDIYKQQVLEFSSKVEVEGELLGSIRYGLSTQRMAKDLRVAREESDAAFFTTIKILISLGVFFVLVGAFVTWRQAIRITSPLGVLTEAADAIASGDHSVQVDVQSGDEIEILASSFNKMVRDLAASYDELEQLNKGLEQKVEERTRDLQQKTDDVENMLKNLRQGIFTVTEGQTIHHEYSAYLEKILDTKDIAGNSIMDVLLSGTNLGSDAVDRVYVALSNMLGKPSINYVMNGHLLPREFEKDAPGGAVKILEAEWNAITDTSGTTQKIMVTLRDVTELRQLQREMGEQKRQLEMVGQILAVRIDDFKTFIFSSTEFLDRNQSLIMGTSERDSEVIGELFRNMHTIKGNARTYGFTFLNDILHESETRYKELREDEDKPWDAAELLEELDLVTAATQAYVDVFDNKLSALADIQVTEGGGIGEDLVQELRGLIDGGRSGSLSLDAILDGLECSVRLNTGQALGDVLSSAISGMASIADELEKPVPAVDITDPNIRIPADVAPLIQNVFVHVFRNAVDHGLESAKEREGAGKAPNGTITLETTLEEDRLIVRVQDDGRGLDLGGLKRKYSEINGDSEVPADEAKIAELIFYSGLSTAEQVTDISGRGVGMDAVKKFLEDRGGFAQVELQGNQEGANFRPFSLVFGVPL